MFFLQSTNNDQTFFSKSFIVQKDYNFVAVKKKYFSEQIMIKITFPDNSVREYAEGINSHADC